MTFLTAAAVLILGVVLTGFNNAHWLLYVPIALLVFAGVTGICPGLVIWNKLGFKNDPLKFV
jgi:hypothetical protein